MNLIYFLLPAVAYSFFNNPIHLYSKNIKGINDIKIIEPVHIENKKDIPAFVFFSGLSGRIPNEIYNNFLNYISSSGVSCFLFNEDIDKSKKIIDYIENHYSNVTIGGHSSGGSKAIKLCSEYNNLNNLILFDPVDDRILNDNKLDYIYNNFFDTNKNRIEMNNIKNYLLVKAENSYKWSLFPPKMPFIPLFDINENIINMNDNTYVIDDIIEETINENGDIVKITKTISKKINTNKKVIDIRNYGHTDLLDEYWSRNMRKIIKDSSKDKSFEEINEYHKFNAYLINQICYNNLDNMKSNLKNEKELKNIKFNIYDI